MLFNEPKLLKFGLRFRNSDWARGFSALQRAEIAEMYLDLYCVVKAKTGFSALQRAEIAEMRARCRNRRHSCVFQCSSTSRNC